mmetsp:Transcript_12138/g.51083  ORF Transcript_12138/g.51083 Transcript_12138/m.51083 type:complete len:246 (+) Transcript_12138:1466-2203(+)
MSPVRLNPRRLSIAAACTSRRRRSSSSSSSKRSHHLAVVRLRWRVDSQPVARRRRRYLSRPRFSHLRSYRWGPAHSRTVDRQRGSPVPCHRECQLPRRCPCPCLWLQASTAFRVAMRCPVVRLRRRRRARRRSARACCRMARPHLRHSQRAQLTGVSHALQHATTSCSSRRCRPRGASLSRPSRPPRPRRPLLLRAWSQASQRTFLRPLAQQNVRWGRCRKAPQVRASRTTHRWPTHSRLRMRGR